jgi:putative acetyltransferase
MNNTAWRIIEDDISSEATRDLIELHLRGMHTASPPGSVFALDYSGLCSAEVTVWTAWRGESLAAIAALKDLGHRVGELKSMRTHPTFLRQGAAAALLEHVILEATARGMIRLSLETGSGPYFDPALSLYRRRGFAPGEAFGGYQPSTFNQFLHLTL